MSASSYIPVMMAQHRCVQPATILNWLYFTQSNITHHKVKILAFQMILDTCLLSKYKFLLWIFENFPTAGRILEGCLSLSYN